ncbi:MAG: hypothetical protein ABI239_01390 [Aquihabitans sp.]
MAEPTPPSSTSRQGLPDRAWLPDKIWLPGLAALLLALVFVAALLVRADGDPSLLVHAAPPWTSESEAPASLTVQDAEDGFDGQFFYRLGVSPWSADEQVAGVEMDLPSLRNARWGYGALAYAFSAGDTDLVPWSLVALNVAAAGILGALGGALARISGRHAAWGLLFVLWPGFAYSLSLDTSELVASVFVVGGLLAARRGRWPVVAALLTAAVLTRDTTAVVPFGIAAAGAWAWWQGRELRKGRDAAETGSAATDQPPPADDPTVGAWPGPLLGGLVPLVVFAGWQLLQRARFGSLPLTSSGDNNLSAPFAGLIDLVTKAVPPDGGEDLFRLLSAIGLVALLLAGASVWRQSSATTGERLAWLPAVAVVAVLNSYLWSGATAFMRAGTEAALLSIALLLAANRDRLLPLAGIGLGGLWLFTAAAQLTKLG